MPFRRMLKRRNGFLQRPGRVDECSKTASLDEFGDFSQLVQIRLHNEELRINIRSYKLRDVVVNDADDLATRLEDFHVLLQYFAADIIENQVDV